MPWIVKTRQEVNERGLSRTRLADQSHEVAGLHREIDSAQHRFFSVTEVHVFVTNVRAGSAQRQRPGRIDDRALHLE